MRLWRTEERMIVLLWKCLNKEERQMRMITKVQTIFQRIRTHIVRSNNYTKILEYERMEFLLRRSRERECTKSLIWLRAKKDPK